MNTDEILLKKAQDAQLVYDDLVRKLGIQPVVPTTFIANPMTQKMFCQGYVKENPFPHVIALVLAKLRKQAVTKLFEEEKVLQTPVIAAVLSLCSEVATQIGALRGDEIKDAHIYTDISFAGLQAIRLYMANHTQKDFKKVRCKSAIRVDNAINGSFYKYKAKDGRDVSFHVYYQSQQKKLVDKLQLNKPSEKFKLMSTKRDKKYLQSVVQNYSAQQLEDLAFDCGACGCIIRSRQEWESTEVGEAVKAMPLINFTNSQKGKIPKLAPMDARGVLSGIKVLDLTHIIAGPVCTRILAEYGADVLMVRRGKFVEQEQAMLELDGWAGKDSIQLDLNNPDQLLKMKDLIKEADVVVYSYQNGCFDKFGLSEKEIRKINPNVIYSNLMCFSDTVWKERPGWAPCAEDITGLSVRNGSLESPKNLNGVPLDYIPGMILALGTLMAIKQKLTDGTACTVTTSLTRGAMYLHECTDFCAKSKKPTKKTEISNISPEGAFDNMRVYVDDTSVGRVGFPAPATYNTKYKINVDNMKFHDGQNGFKSGQIRFL